MMLTLTIPHATPSLNEFANPGARQWKYRALCGVWSRAVNDALVEARIAARRPLAWPRPPRERVWVAVTRYAPAHQWLDQDNLLGGLKPILDALKTYGLIADDAPTAITLSADQAISSVAHPHRWTAIVLRLEPPEWYALRDRP